LSSHTAEISSELALETVPGRLSGRALILWGLAIAIGVAGFFLALQENPQRAWQALWVNFLFWTGIAGAGAAFGPVLAVAKGHWGKPFRRVAEGTIAFLPISLGLFVALYFGAGQIFPWTGPVEGPLNRTWLTVDGVFVRNGVLLLALYAANLAYLRLSLRLDAPLLAGRLDGWRRTLVQRLGRGWRGDEVELERSQRILGRFAPIMVLGWMIVFSMLSFDMAMSLMPGFTSVVWGAHYVIGGWLGLLALVAILANRYSKRYPLDGVWGRWQFHDLGKLMFAFVIFWTYLWWSQYLVIWYGNLGRETIFFEQRTSHGFSPWLDAEMILIFGLPFLLLLGRRIKMNPAHLAKVGGLILLGFWIERFNLVAPSVWRGSGVPFGWPEITVTLGCLGLFGLSYALFASTFPKIPIREGLIEGSAETGP